MKAIPQAGLAQPGSTERFSAGVFEAGSGEKLPYRLLVPENIRDNSRYPLVLFLHGLGESGTDNRRQLDVCVGAFEKAQDEFPSFVLAPQCPKKGQGEPWGWTDTHPEELIANKPCPGEIGKHLRLTLDLLALLAERLPIDKKRLYVAGISMGGFGTWELIGRRPGLFAAAVPICGGGRLCLARALAKTPAWVFHGGRDSIVSPEFSRRTVSAIRVNGGKLRYTEFPEIGHNCWENAFATTELIDWIYSQKR